MIISIRISLWFLLLSMSVVGFWAQFMPTSFYLHFPALWAWVSVDGPYNEHFIRDIGSLNLALAVPVLLALLKPSPVLLRLVALSTLVYQVPHTIYHSSHLHVLPDIIQQIAQMVLLILGIAASLTILWASYQTAPQT